jgi:hypothetical protein
MDIDDDEEDMGIDQSYANGDKIMKNQLNSLYGQLEGMMAYHWSTCLAVYCNLPSPGASSFCNMASKSHTMNQGNICSSAST